jgi:hypothetical protein
MVGLAALPLPLPAQSTAKQGAIPVAFPISNLAELIDFAGPWSIFSNAVIPGRTRDMPAFHLYTVGAAREPVNASGIHVVPDYAFDTAPAPKVIVIGAQSGGDAMPAWIAKQAPGPT